MPKPVCIVPELLQDLQLMLRCSWPGATSATIPDELGFPKNDPPAMSDGLESYQIHPGCPSFLPDIGIGREPHLEINYVRVPGNNRVNETLFFTNMAIRVPYPFLEASNAVVAGKSPCPQFRKTSGGQGDVAPTCTGIAVDIFVMDFCLQLPAVVEFNLRDRLPPSIKIV
jgi:hypothetical protein